MFMCNECNKSFKNKDNLLRHVSYNCKKVINKKIFKCDNCYKKACRKDSLMRHKRRCNLSMNRSVNEMNLFNESLNEINLFNESVNEMNLFNESANVNEMNLFNFYEWY